MPFVKISALKLTLPTIPFKLKINPGTFEYVEFNQMSTSTYW